MAQVPAHVLNPCYCQVRVGCGSKLEVGDVVVERNFVEFLDELIHSSFRKRHEPSLRLWGHGEVALEGSGVVSNADPGAEDEGVVAIESSG
jgi:hypothetical protein